MPDTATDSATLDNLIIGDFPVIKAAVTVEASQTLVRGAVMGIITSGGQATELDDTAQDGSEVFYGVLLEDVTTGGGETQVAPVALTGIFNAAALTFAGSTTAADMKTEMRALSCFQQDLSDNVVGE